MPIWLSEAHCGVEKVQKLIKRLFCEYINAYAKESKYLYKEGALIGKYVNANIRGDCSPHIKENSVPSVSLHEMLLNMKMVK